MKFTKNTFLALSLLTLAGCAEDELSRDLLNQGDKTGDGKAVFNITTETSQIGIITRADGEEIKAPITELNWLVADKNGKIMPHYTAEPTIRTPSSLSKDPPTATTASSVWLPSTKLKA